MTEFPSKLRNRYRRAFDWRVSSGDRESLRKATTAIVHLASSDFPDILEDFLDISRRRMKNRTALAKLQLHMLEEIIFQEGAAKHYRKKLKELREARKPDDSDKEYSKTIELCKTEQFFHQLYANAIRGIGDGLAWRALGYDRAVTRLMSGRPTKQTVMAEGTIQELREWSAHFDSGTGLAILNPLTNCLAVGDVTVVNNDDSVEIVEVKSSNTKSSRKVRQKQKMSEVVTLLGTGAGQAEDKQVEIEVFPIVPETGLDQIAELLTTAAVHGCAARKISNCLYAEAADLRTLRREQIEAEVRPARKQEIAEWQERGDLIFEMSSLDNLSFGPNCAPFSVFPFDNRTCVELLIGAKSYTTFLNLNAVAREFEFRNWRVDRTTDQLLQEGNTDAMLRVSKNGFHVYIPPADIMRMQLEALRPKTVIECCELKYKQGPGGSTHEYMLALYNGESKIWN